MSIRTWTDGLSRLEIERDPAGRIRISVHDQERPGFTVTVSPAVGAEIAAFLRPVELFATRPEDYWRDQYDPRDEEVR